MYSFLSISQDFITYTIIHTQLQYLFKVYTYAPLVCKSRHFEALYAMSVHTTQTFDQSPTHPFLFTQLLNDPFVHAPLFRMISVPKITILLIRCVVAIEFIRLHHFCYTHALTCILFSSAFLCSMHSLSTQAFIVEEKKRRRQ